MAATRTRTQTFEEAIATIPYSPRQTAASGLLPPIMRALNHVTFLASWLADETAPPTDELALTELTAAKEHWNVRALPGVLSAATNQALAQYGIALDAASTEYISWETRETRLTNIRKLANHGAGLCAALDRELIGIRDSDPGLAF